MSEFTIALIGAPNTGKTSLFNKLTLQNKDTGNWSGVTIEENHGTFTALKQTVRVIDFPGAYAFQNQEYSSEEEKYLFWVMASRNFDAVVFVIDARNVERQLYLLTQLIELEVPLVIAFSFADEASKDYKRYAELFHKLFKVNCVFLKNDKSIEELKRVVLMDPVKVKNMIRYPQPVNYAIDHIEQLIHNQPKPHWLALKLVEACKHDVLDTHIAVSSQMKIQRKYVVDALGEDPDMLIAQGREDFIAEHLSITRADQRSETSKKVDKVLLNPMFGLPILFLVIATVFYISIGIAGNFQDFFELISKAAFVELPYYFLTLTKAPEMMRYAIAGGLGGGIAMMASFIPIIFTLFFFIALLEESGYMSRVAVMSHNTLARFGLNGNAMIPLIVSFGCNVPGILAVKLLDNKAERIRVALMAPFMSCSARLAVFSIFCSAFFTDHPVMVVMGLYLIGILAAFITVMILNIFIPVSKKKEIILTLPKYHRPKFSVLINKARNRLYHFLNEAGRLIIVIFMVVQIGTYAWYHHVSKDFNNVISEMSKITYAFKSIGITEDNWQAVGALATGILAKEIAIGTLSALYNNQLIFDKKNYTYQEVENTVIKAAYSIRENFLGIESGLEELGEYKFHDKKDTTLKEHLKKHFKTPVAAFAYLVFVLLYFPCISVFASIKQEVGLKWAALSLTWSTILAFTIASLCYYVGMLL